LQSKNFSRALTALVFLIAPAILFADGVTIVSPADNATVTSPVRVVAEFPRTASINSITVSVDHVNVPQPEEAVTPLDTKISMTQGSHLLTVTARQDDGTVLTSSKWLTVGPGAQNGQMQSQDSPNMDSPNLDNPNVGDNGYVGNDVEEMSGWYTYPDYGHPVCSDGPALVATPSLDGVAGKFYLGPTGQFNNCLWPIKLGSSRTAANFLLDTYYRLNNPSVSQGVEFSHNKHVGTKWYKFSVQCSYNYGNVRIWDTAGNKWSNTSIPCRRPASGHWEHITVKTKISNGKAVFISIKLNGILYSLNKSFYPRTEASSYSFGVHFQMNGNRAGNAYYTYLDNFTFNAW